VSLSQVLETLAGFGIVGALTTIAVAAVNIAVNIRRDRDQHQKDLERELERRRRELTGLLRLLDIETGFYHELRLAEFEESPAGITRLPAPYFRTKDWDAVKLQLSQLLDSTQFADFIRYYTNVESMNQYRLDLAEPTARRQAQVQASLPNLREQNSLVRSHILEHLPDETHEAGTTVTPAFPNQQEVLNHATGSEETTTPEEILPGADRIFVVYRMGQVPYNLRAHSALLPLTELDEMLDRRACKIVSHSFTLQEDGSGFFTGLFERIS
jgi:hypothetical protein